ncbi:hypothetical protein CLG85_023145 [Yangia mangrovi]|uniref:Tripartite tricarboxylate transporter family receptor n=1 Tax=Alloyangia mangrovi TaxID=1779329 RepID=A0ABT2KS83_9RHOB|nr:hypothetical protein [Alloyangia mangrovi]
MTRLMTAAALGLVMATAGAASAQDWPKRAVDMVVAYGAGGGTDTIARQLAEPMSASLGQPVVVKNLAGAGGDDRRGCRRRGGARWLHALHDGRRPQRRRGDVQGTAL